MPMKTAEIMSPMGCERTGGAMFMAPTRPCITALTTLHVSITSPHLPYDTAIVPVQPGTFNWNAVTPGRPGFLVAGWLSNESPSAWYASTTRQNSDRAERLQELTTVEGLLYTRQNPDARPAARGPLPGLTGETFLYRRCASNTTGRPEDGQPAWPCLNKCLAERSVRLEFMGRARGYS